MRRALLLLAQLVVTVTTSAQTNNLLTYAGGAGNERSPLARVRNAGDA